MCKLAGTVIWVAAILGGTVGSLSPDAIQICISIGVALYAIGADFGIRNKK